MTEPGPANDARLAALARYAILDTAADPGFDGLARLAAEICRAPVGLITFVDERRQFFKAGVGFDGERVAPLDAGFCPQVVRERMAVTIGDARADPRHAGNPATIEGGVRFYAGVPLVTADDHVLGTLCVLDTQPRPGALTPGERQSLETLAAQVMTQLELRRSEAVALRESVRAEKHARRLSLIARASSLMLAARDPREMVRDLFAMLRQDFGMDVGFHYRCGEGALGLVAASGLTPRQEHAAVRVEFGQMVCGIVAERREPMCVAGIQQSDEPLFRPLKGLGLESYYSTPLLAGGELLGTIAFGRRDRDFSAGEVEALQTITSQLATALERQRAEAGLRKSEVRLTTALATARLGSFEWDPSTGIVLLDPRSREIFGFGDEGVRDADVFGRIHPADIALVQARSLAAVETRTRLEIAYRIVRPDGSERVIDSFGDFLARSATDAGPMVGVFADITDRRRSDDALRESEMRYRTLFESVEQGFCVFDMVFDPAGRPVDYVFVEVNPAFEAQTGLVDAAGRRISELAPGHEQRWYDTYAHVALTGEPLRIEDYAQALGRWYEIYAYRVGAPEQHRVAALFNDVSDRKSAEAQIRDLNETLERQVAERTAELRQFRKIVEATTSPICAFDTEYRLIAFNRAHNDEFRRVNGFDTKIGDVFPDLFLAEQQAVMRALMARALSGEAFTVTETFGRPQFGQPCWEISYTPLRDAAGTIIGAFHLATDISDRLRADSELALAQEALRQSQKMEAMGSLTGGVAHDFNNLLTPIVGSLDLLQRKGLGTEREQRLIAGAVQSADRARILVQRLLAFARRQPLQPTAVDLAPLVLGMADLVSSTTGPQIRVVVDAADGLPFAKVDPNQLEMAILNLAVNARDAMVDGGTLRISVAAEQVAAVNRAGVAAGRYLRLSVADTGSGMDEATLKRAIEPFFSTKGVGKGTGLGLSMAHGLASQLGGALTIGSMPGVGTNVELWLPESVEPAIDAPAAAMPDAADAARHSGTALLVDDEDLVRLSTADMLVELGYTVVEASSAEAALRLVEEGLAPDLLVTDHLMPGMTGTDLARALLVCRPGIKALVVSGYAETEGIEPDLPRLAKPFRSVDLAESLAALG